MNNSSTLAYLRQFIMAAKPTPDVSVTVKTNCWTSERNNSDHGTRVILIETNQHPFYEAVVEGLNKFTTVKRKSCIAQITVWDVEANKAVRCATRKPYRLFHQAWCACFAKWMA